MEVEEEMEIIRNKNIEAELQLALRVWAKSRGLNAEDFVAFFVQDAMKYLRASLLSVKRIAAETEMKNRI